MLDEYRLYSKGEHSAAEKLEKLNELTSELLKIERARIIKLAPLPPSKARSEQSIRSEQVAIQPPPELHFPEKIRHEKFL